MRPAQTRRLSPRAKTVPLSGRTPQAPLAACSQHARCPNLSPIAALWSRWSPLLVLPCSECPCHRGAMLFRCTVSLLSGSLLVPCVLSSFSALLCRLSLSVFHPGPVSHFLLHKPFHWHWPKSRNVFCSPSTNVSRHGCRLDPVSSEPGRHVYTSDYINNLHRYSETQCVRRK